MKVVRPARFLVARHLPGAGACHLGETRFAFTLAAIPVEATTAAGWAIRQASRAAAIVGLANEYIGYTTTASEYQAQQYEGASTLLGPGEAAGLARLLVLAAEGRGDPPSAGTVPAQSFRAGPRRKMPSVPKPCWCAASATWWTKIWSPCLPRHLRRLESRIPRFDWDEDPSRRLAHRRPPSVRLHKRRRRLATT